MGVLVNAPSETVAPARWLQSRRVVIGGFALIWLGVVIVTVFATVQARRLDGRIHALVDDMLNSVASPWRRPARRTSAQDQNGGGRPDRR
jgi:hypothetical protein